MVIILIGLSFKIEQSNMASKWKKSVVSITQTTEKCLEDSLHISIAYIGSREMHIFHKEVMV